MSEPIAQSSPRPISLEQLVEMLLLGNPLSFRAGDKGLVEVMTFAGTDVRTASGLDVSAACDWWLNNKMQNALCWPN